MNSRAFAQPQSLSLIESLETRALLSAVPTPIGIGGGGPNHPLGGVTIHERADKPFTANVGSFIELAPGNGYAATIHWGDGQTSKAKLVIEPHGIIGVDTFAMDAIGQHDYEHAGNYNITVDVTRQLSPGGPIFKVTDIHSKAVVAPAVSNGGVTLHEKAGQRFTDPLGSFIAVVPNTDFNVLIHWGDGTTSVGKLIPGHIIGIDTEQLIVKGTHTYAKPGEYDITVVLTRPGASAPWTMIDSQAIVAK